MNEKQRETFLAKRVKQLYDLAGVSFDFMEDHFSVATSSLYNMLNGTRKQTHSFVQEMAALFSLTAEEVSDPRFKFKKHLPASPELEHFRKVAIMLKGDKKAGKFILDELILTKKLSKFLDVKGIRELCLELGGEYKSDRISKALVHLKKKGYLIGEQRKIVKIDGTKGSRDVHYYKIKDGKKSTVKKSRGK